MNPITSLKKLLRHVLLNKSLVVIGFISVLLTTVSGLFIPKLLGDLLDALHQNMSPAKLNQLGAFLGLAFISQAFFSFARRVTFTRISASALEELRFKTFEHIIHLPMKFFSERSAGELSSRISSDIQMLERLFKNLIPVSIRLLATFIGGVIMLFLTSWKLSVIFVFCLILIISMFVIYGKKLRNISSKLQKNLAGSNVVVQESLVDIYSIKSFMNEPLQKDRYKRSLGSLAGLGIKLGNSEARFSLYSDLITSLLLISVVWAGSYWIANGTLSMGAMLTFSGYLIAVIMAFTDITNIYSDVQRGLGSVNTVQSLMEEQKELLGEHSTNQLSGSFSFENVDFAYPSNPGVKVLKNVSFKVPKGERWALVGTSGSGKSTLASLLIQMHAPDNGVIRFDDIPSDDLSIRDVRSHIGVIPQSSSLFSGTIKDNILFGKPDATEEEFKEIAIEASIDEFVKDLPEGYETEVGEHGMRLSGGQKQRILIARAMLKKPKVLVLDEATSALDNETEMLVQAAIHLVTQKCTSLIIAHRLSTIKNADNILVMMHGEIVEQGTYEELMARPNSHFRFLNLTNFKA